MLLKYAIIENQYYAERHRGGCMTLVMFITIVTSILSAYFAYKMHKKGFDSSQCLIYSILLLICICALFLIISKSFYLKTYISIFFLISIVTFSIFELIHLIGSESNRTIIMILLSVFVVGIFLVDHFYEKGTENIEETTETEGQLALINGHYFESEHSEIDNCTFYKFYVIEENQELKMYQISEDRCNVYLTEGIATYKKEISSLTTKNKYSNQDSRIELVEWTLYIPKS